MHAVLRHRFGAHIRVMGKDGHLEPAQFARHQAGDMPESDQPQRLSLQMPAGEGGVPVPDAFSHQPVLNGDLPYDRKQQPDRMV